MPSQLVERWVSRAVILPFGWGPRLVPMMYVYVHVRVHCDTEVWPPRRSLSPPRSHEDSSDAPVLVPSSAIFRSDPPNPVLAVNVKA